MKIRNKKTGGVIDIPKGMENQMQQHLLQGGDPMELLFNKGKKAKLSGKKIKKRQEGGKAQQQGGDQQAQMQQLVQMAEQALSQGAKPEQVAQMLVQKGVPQEVVQQVIQAAMQDLQQQGQQQNPQEEGQEQGQQQNPQEEQQEMKIGGKIHIKASHEGRFNAYKKRTGKTTAEALKSSDPHVRQMANFANNASKWKKQTGGNIPYPNMEMDGQDSAAFRMGMGMDDGEDGYAGITNNQFYRMGEDKAHPFFSNFRDAPPTPDFHFDDRSLDKKIMPGQFQPMQKNGGALNSIKAPYVYSYEHGGFIPMAQYGRNENTGDTQLRGNAQEDIDYNQLYKDEISKRKPSEKTKQKAPNVNVSIVDYLASKGQKFDMSTRRSLAEKAGIKNYTGTGDQNKELLNILHNLGSSTDPKDTRMLPEVEIVTTRTKKGEMPKATPKFDLTSAYAQYEKNKNNPQQQSPAFLGTVGLNQQPIQQSLYQGMNPALANYTPSNQSFTQGHQTVYDTPAYQQAIQTPTQTPIQQGYSSFKPMVKGIQSIQQNTYNQMPQRQGQYIQSPYMAYGGQLLHAQTGISFMNPQTQWNPNLGVGNFSPQMPIEGDPMITEQGRQQQYPIEMNRMEQNSISSINPNQTPTQQNNFGLGKSPSKVKSKGVKSTFKGQNQMAPVIPNMFSANPYLAKANFYRNQAIQDFAGIQGGDKQKTQDSQEYGQTGFDQNGNAISMRPSDPTLNQDIWGFNNYNQQLGGFKYGGIMQNGGMDTNPQHWLNQGNSQNSSQNGMNIGAGVTSAMLADLNTAKGFTDIAGSMYQNSAVAGIESEQRRSNLIGQYQNTPPTFSDGWGGMQPLEGAYVPIGKYGGMMQNGGDMGQQFNGIPSKFTGDRHYEGGIPVNTDGSSSNANDMKTHRSNANLEVEGGEYFVPGMQNGGQAKNDVILSDRKNIGWNGMSPSENYEEATKAELGISANKFNKGITKDEKFRADNVKFLSNKISEETAGVMQKLAVPVTNSMQELAQQTYLKQEQVKYGKGMDNDLESIMQSNQQPMAQYGAQIPDDMNYYDTGKMFMANGGKLPMAKDGITVADKNNTYIKKGGKWYYYNNKTLGAEVPATANVMTKEANNKNNKGFNESSGGKSLDKLYSSLNKTKTNTTSTPATNAYAPYSIYQTSQNNAKTETGQYITSPPIQTANWKDVIFPSVEKNHPELRNKLIPEDPTRANALLQENMYDDALDRIQGIGAYEGATAQDKEAALAEFKRMWGQHGKVKFNSAAPGQKAYPDAIKNMANWKVGDANTLSDLNSLRGNFIDNKLERRYLLTPQGQSVPPVTPPVTEEDKPFVPTTYKTDTTPVKQGINMPSFDINIPSFDINIPNVYAKKPITSYDVNPYFQQPHVISPYINDIQRLQYAANANLGTSGAELATRANLFGQGNTEYGKRYYDASVYNAGAKTQADAQNAQAAYTAANQNRSNQWQTESAQNQRDAAIQGQQELDRNSYLKSLTDKEHERMMGIATKDIYDPNVDGYKYMTANLGNKPAIDETTYKIDKFGNYVPVSAKNKSKFGGKVNKLNTKKFKSKK